MLLQKAGDNPFWEVPGGRIDDDESMLQTLDRELHEEVPNINEYSEPVLVDAYRLAHDIKPDLGLCLVFFKTAASFNGDEPTISDEHVAYRWVTIPEALKIVDGPLRAVLAKV